MSEEQPSSSPSSSSSSAIIDLPHASAAAGVYTHSDLAAAAGTYTTDQAAASYMSYCTNPSGFVPADGAAAASQHPPRPYPIITVESTGPTSEYLPQAPPTSHVMIPPPGLALPPGLAPPPGFHPPLGYPQAVAQVQQPDPTYIQPPQQQPSRMTMRSQPLPMFAFDKTIDGEMEHWRRLHDIQRYDEGEPLEYILSDLVPQCVWDEDKVQRGEAVDRNEDRDSTPDSRYTSTERATRRERRRALSRERSLAAQNWKLSGAPNELTGNLHHALMERRRQQTEEREKFIANDDRSKMEQAKEAWQLIKDSDSKESHTWRNPNANDGRWNPAHDRAPLPTDRPSDEAVKYGRFPKSSTFRAQMEFLAARDLCKDSSISAEKGREAVGEVLGGETKSVSSGGIAEAEQSVEVLVEESKPLLVHLVKEIQSRTRRKLAESDNLLTDLSSRVDSLMPQLASYIARCKGLIRVLLSDRERYLEEKERRQKGGKGGNANAEVDVDLLSVHGDIRSFLGLLDLESALRRDERGEMKELERAVREFEGSPMNSSGVSSSSKPNATRDVQAELLQESLRAEKERREKTEEEVTVSVERVQQQHAAEVARLEQQQAESSTRLAELQEEVEMERERAETVCQDRKRVEEEKEEARAAVQKEREEKAELQNRLTAAEQSVTHFAQAEQRLLERHAQVATEFSELKQAADRSVQILEQREEELRKEKAEGRETGRLAALSAQSAREHKAEAIRLRSQVQALTEELQTSASTAALSEDLEKEKRKSESLQQALTQAEAERDTSHVERQQVLSALAEEKERREREREELVSRLSAAEKKNKEYVQKNQQLLESEERLEKEAADMRAAREELEKKERELKEETVRFQQEKEEAEAAVRGGRKGKEQPRNLLSGAKRAGHKPVRAQPTFVVRPMIPRRPLRGLRPVNQRGPCAFSPLLRAPTGARPFVLPPGTALPVPPHPLVGPAAVPRRTGPPLPGMGAPPRVVIAPRWW
uniref:Uncharacterized protein n=1 Tax=Chromera velia CCMP2878 TaxID=1169474 RepID=A0A0G4FGU7_9ALVE|eukprot:Cvel_16755.t1-p1 / transcript=Cvel_16755.t1 / gene=Cvel_16755 / organism=Chromera_velia_CCMP2878 / gene_product=hypothetical protein / transcript_product=hypothetical protein / location=Cvel_scaffold1306:14385-18034(-) / protein_length=993 / sequence_SO=supercontig / SO=protein_coding / is_pseudo=false